jgi:UDPglucose 6-dehydrogenase
MLIVNKCTVPVGMVRLLGELINELLPPGRTDQTTSRGDVFSISSSPEFPREGKAVFDTLFPDRLVLGAASEADASGSTPYRLPSSSGASRPTSLRYRQVPPCLG